MKMKEKSEKVGLKLNIQKTKIMASSPITLWQIGGETVATVRAFILGAPKWLQMVNCSHETKRRLLLWRKAITNLDSILKSRDITLLTTAQLVKAMVFPVQFSCSAVSDSVTPWTAAHQAPPSKGFSRQEYWSGVPSPSPWRQPYEWIRMNIYTMTSRLFHDYGNFIYRYCCSVGKSCLSLCNLLDYSYL